VPAAVAAGEASTSSSFTSVSITSNLSSVH
jgi:hypothetical protein